MHWQVSLLKSHCPKCWSPVVVAAAVEVMLSFVARAQVESVAADVRSLISDSLVAQTACD